MWHWIKRWRDKAMRELCWPFHRNGGPLIQGIHFGYERAGLSVRNEPIPPTADSVFVDVLIRFPGRLVRRKSDFHLQLLEVGESRRISASTLHRHSRGDAFLLQFRLPPPQQPSAVEVYWRDYLLSQVTLPVLSFDRFAEHLAIRSPTTFIRLGDATVPAKAFLPRQCRGLFAGAMLESVTSLLPLLDQELTVEFEDHSLDRRYVVPVRLTGQQLTSRQAMVVVVAPKTPKRIGFWSVRWRLGDRVKASTEIRTVSRTAFRRSLHLVDTRFVFQERGKVKPLASRLLRDCKADRVGPCFVISSGIPDLAALLHLQVLAQRPDLEATLLHGEDVIVTSSPSLFMPGTVSRDDLEGVAAFELRALGKLLGILPTGPAPKAEFSSEGGFRIDFKPYEWTQAADEELNDRLCRLMEIPPLT